MTKNNQNVVDTTMLQEDAAGNMRLPENVLETTQTSVDTTMLRKDIAGNLRLPENS